jgi:hypothetical protein
MATAIGVLHATSAGAAPKVGVPLFNDRAAPNLADLPAVAKAQSGVAGTLNPAAFSAPALELTLASGEKITAHLQRVARDTRKATQSWIGTFEDSPGSLLVLTKSKGVVTGFGNRGETTFEVRPAAANKHVAFEIDASRLAKGDAVRKNLPGAADLMGATVDYGTSGSTTLAAGDAIVHDVLILYTSYSAAKWGQATLTSMVQSAVQAANQAYANSQVNVTLNVVGLQQGPITEGSGMGATVNALKTNSTVRALRDSLAADMVVLINENTDYCGYADLWYSWSGSTTNWDAYAGVQSSCLSTQTLAHEVGHLQQLDHNRENATGLAAYGYSYGHRLCTADGFRDIMSYPCSYGGSTRISYFSNPNLTYNGYPIGVSYESSPSTAADSARSLRETAMTAASYRVGTSTGTSTLPAAPSSLSAQSVAYNQVSLAWTDNSSNETGFKVERSTDSVNFVEVASLGAGARAYTDIAVAANSRYAYRARAYNSVGASAYSNTVSVTTPDVAPAAPAAPASPSTIAATNNGDGSALVAWSSNTTGVASFEVRRSKYDSRKQVWSAYALAASVPASVLSIADNTGAGAFRYTVRAVNAGGASASAGPAEVTVTSPNGSKRKNQSR